MDCVQRVNIQNVSMQVQLFLPFAFDRIQLISKRFSEKSAEFFDVFQISDEQL